MAMHLLSAPADDDFPLFPPARYPFAMGQDGYAWTAPTTLSPDPRSSNYSSASGPSVASSAMNSPTSLAAQSVPMPDWSPADLRLHPGLMPYDALASTGHEYTFPTGMEDLALDLTTTTKSSFVGECMGFPLSSLANTSDPSILHPPFPPQANEAQLFQTHMYPVSPAISLASSRSPQPHLASPSPYLDASYASFAYPPPMLRRASMAISHRSLGSQDGNLSSEDAREKGRCAYPDCGKIFKDLKAHMLTHQTERPEKCPIQTCEYHVKGFARKYDKNRHTLTHYKGTMVCGFCPGSGSAAEKSFNRADVFKRHLTSVHAVEQTPPNSRKRSSLPLTKPRKLSGYAPDATGKCSTCSATFGNAQDFYEHLDDCVLRIVQQEEPSEAINAARLAEVAQDIQVHETLIQHALPTTPVHAMPVPDDEEDEDEDDEDVDDLDVDLRFKKTRVSRNPAGGVQKSRGMTHSKGGVTLSTKGRKKRKDFPSSWGCAPTQMKMKKRVLTVFDGPRRLWKDDMMLDTDYEVRMMLGDDKSYVTDLDVQSLRRANAFHGATDEEKGPWIADDLTGVDLEQLMSSSDL